MHWISTEPRTADVDRRLPYIKKDADVLSLDSTKECGADRSARTESKGSRKAVYTAYMIGVLLLAYTFSFIDRQILSLLVEPMKRDLSISDTQMSLLQGLSFALFYTFLGLPLGRLSDLRSRRGLIACGIFLWSVMTALCGVAKTYGMLFLARMGVGVGEAALSPAAYSLIADSVEKKHLGKAIAVYSMGIYLGGGLALIAGGVVVDWAASMGSIVLPIVGEIYSWQLVFLTVGLPGLLLVPLMFTIAEPQRKVSAASAKNADIGAVLRFFKNNKRTILFANFGAAFASLAGYGSLAWVPTYLMRTYQMDASEVGLAFGTIVLLGGSLGVISGGWLADKWYSNGRQDAKLRVAMLAGIIGLVPTALYPLVSDLSLTLVLLAVSTYFTNFMMGLGPAAIQEVVPNQMRGQFSALYLFVVNLVGLGIGPTAVALCTDYLFDKGGISYSLALVPTCALAISAFFLWRCLSHYRKSMAANLSEL